MQTIKLIKQWGADRGITINGTHQGQWYKLVSEYGELCDNLAKGRDVRDDIGDMFVVMVMICEIGKVDLDKAFELTQIQTRSGASVYELVGTLHIDIGSFRFGASVSKAADLIASLTALAGSHGTTLDECIDVAYNDIKDRKGYLNADGVFIKEVVQ